MLIQSENIIIRRWNEDDYSELINITNSPKISENLDDNFIVDHSVETAKEFVKKLVVQEKCFAIIYDGKLAGEISLRMKDKDKKYTALIKYWLGEKYWNKGIATTAVKLLIKYAFNNYNIERIEGKVYTWNKPSTKVLEKSGFKFEGTLRKSTIKNSQIVDEFLYSVIKSDIIKN
jgi:RimJ/RimL family protein N-acetyltransferase